MKNIQYLPVGLFGSTVAMANLSIALKQAAQIFGIPAAASMIIGILAGAMYIVLLLFYLAKIIMYPKAVKEELANPVVAHFLGTFFITAVLLAYLAIPYSLAFARIVWLIGSIGGLTFMYILMDRLYKGQLSAENAVPPVLIPGLTVLNAANTGGGMQFNWLGNEVDSILFSFGIVYVLLFFIIISYRLIHGGALPLFLGPTLLLMSTPFEASFLAYLKPGASVDRFASVLFYFGLLVFLVLFFNVFKKGLPFMTTWWASCFSLAALTNAAIKYTNLSPDILVRDLAGVLLIATTLLISFTFALTMERLLSGRLFNPI
jgi:tellurite resistance protein